MLIIFFTAQNDELCSNFLYLEFRQILNYSNIKLEKKNLC